MTIHKGQGSQADRVTVLLPAEESRLLTRELFYTAVTRRPATVRVVGTEDAVRAAVRHRRERATGLRQPLAGAAGIARYLVKPAPASAKYREVERRFRVVSAPRRPRFRWRRRAAGRVRPAW